MSVFARVAIMGFVVLIALEQLQIAQALLNELFGAIVAAAALAFGLAFGLGGQETAKRLLNRSEKSLNIAASQVDAQTGLAAADRNALARADQTTIKR